LQDEFGDDNDEINDEEELKNDEEAEDIDNDFENQKDLQGCLDDSQFL
tara:strand:- start:1607 stop:1750 length:144 start_codon:yes stop_codon:yes gene_type:complete